MHARCARVELLRSSHAARRATPAHPLRQSAQRVSNALIWKPALFRNLEYLNRAVTKMRNGEMDASFKLQFTFSKFLVVFLLILVDA